MKILFVLPFLLLLPAMGNPPPVDCAEWAQKTEQTFRKMDEAIKLKAGMLLGEMETAKGALEGCIEQNKAVSTRMAMVWFLADGGCFATVVLLLLHQRRMKRALRLLPHLVNIKDQVQPVKYAPSQNLFWAAVGVMGTTFFLINLFALVL
jgi:hypothetical protein